MRQKPQSHSISTLIQKGYNLPENISEGRTACASPSLQQRGEKSMEKRNGDSLAHDLEYLYNTSSPRLGTTKTESHGDLITHALDYFKERTSIEDDSFPYAFQEIKQSLEKVKEAKKRILLLYYDGFDGFRVAITLDYIGESWAKGTSTVHRNHEAVKIPYSFHYSDVYCHGSKMKIIVEGTNPHEQT